MQLIQPNIQARIFVIDNDKDGSAREVVGDMACYSAIPISYVVEPKRGIAAARNAAIDAGWNSGAEWIAFIDDDEVADPDWLANLMAPEYLDTPVLEGFHTISYPDAVPFWCMARGKKARPSEEGVSRKTATSGNVRFSADLIRAGLRFDETIGLMGGEDVDFFGRARKAGFEIRRTNRAIVREHAHAERLTYRAQVYRAYWCAASDIKMYVSVRGAGWAWTRKAHTVPTQMAFGLIELLASPLFLFGGVELFKRRALAGGKKLGKATGRAAGLLGIMPRPYAKVVGK